MSKVDNKELNIVKLVANIAEEKYAIKMTSKTLNIIKTVEEFIRKNNLICYGGMAINNILPKRDQFYSNKDFPDYDFFSNDALKHAKELTDIYYKAGYGNVEAKSGFHPGTYKVYVNFFNIADITQLNQLYYENLKKKAITVNKIMYCPPDFLRMSLYLELSRPKGDVSRWEKIFPRLRLLNKNYPMKSKKCSNKKETMTRENINNYNKIKNYLIKEKVIFFGGFADKLYTKYSKKKSVYNQYILDVLSPNAKLCSDNLKKNNSDIKITKKEGIGELIPQHYVIKINDKIYVNIYQSQACYTYNKIKVGKNIVNIATIFTILSFYLIFIFTNNEMYDINRTLCTAHMLQNIYLKNKLKNSGLLKVFTIQCLGEQETFEDILQEKKDKFKELKKDSKDYEKWFLKYTPKESKVKKKPKKGGSKKTKKNNKTIFYYVYMENCPYCEQFEKSGVFEELQDEFKNIQFKKIDGPKNPRFKKKHKIKTYPALLLKKNNKIKIFPSDDRNLEDLNKFIR